jgi:hypothetical protein
VDLPVWQLPPVLQVALVVALVAFTALSVAARFSPRLEWLWNEPREERGLEHVVQYTVVPALVTIAWTTGVVWNWSPATPWCGTWSVAAVVVAFVGVGGGFMSIITGATLGKRWDLSDASKPGSFVPLLLILGGIALLSGGILLPKHL